MRRPSPLSCLGAVLAAGSPHPAAGQTDVDGSSGPGGVTIRIVRFRGTERVHVEGGGGDGCRYELVDPPILFPEPDPAPPPPGGEQVRLLLCNGFPGGSSPSGRATSSTSRSRPAAGRGVRADDPGPTLTVHVNPPSAGLAGLESWFWATGYDGGPITHHLEVFDVAVDVQCITGVRWQFGDGATLDGDLGRPYPPGRRSPTSTPTAPATTSRPP